MQTRLGFIAGAAFGYVLGARAGRQRYEQIKNRAEAAWADPRVQDQVATATEVAKDKAALASSVAKEKAAEVADLAKEKAPELQAKVADFAGKAQDSAKSATEQAKGTAKSATEQAKAKVSGNSSTGSKHDAEQTAVVPAPPAGVQLADATEDIDARADG